jgi:hypothetical protein
MVPDLIWLPDDALAGRCSVEEVGTLREGNESLTLADGSLSPAALARRLAPIALMHLARLAQGEGRPAVEACRELLTWAYVSPSAIQGSASPQTELPSRDYLNGQRFAGFQQGALPGLHEGHDDVHTND